MTAVEWLMEQITYTNEFGCVCNSFIETADLSAYFERAKEMEKQQIFDAIVWFDDTERHPHQIEIDVEQYYNETFKNK